MRKNLCFILTLIIVLLLPTWVFTAKSSQAAGRSFYKDRASGNHKFTGSFRMKTRQDTRKKWTTSIRIKSDNYGRNAILSDKKKKKLKTHCKLFIVWLVNTWENHHAADSDEPEPADDNSDGNTANETTGENGSTNNENSSVIEEPAPEENENSETNDSAQNDPPPVEPEMAETNGTEAEIPVEESTAGDAGANNPIAPEPVGPNSNEPQSEDATHPTEQPEQSVTVYEDAEDGLTDGWNIYTGDPATATVTNVFDDIRGNNVILFNGIGLDHGFALFNGNGSVWNNAGEFTAEWSINFSEPFVVYFEVQSTAGRRYLQYTPVDFDDLGSESMVHHGIGSHTYDGTWHMISRDLAMDLHDAQPDVDIIAVDGFLIRGSGRVDDIKLLPDSADSDGDGLTDVSETNRHGTDPYSVDSDGDGLADNDEIELYGTDPTLADSDNDKIDDLTELNYWGAAWNTDIDADGLVNLLDRDSDNDSVKDGVEIDQGADPADNKNTPAAVFEDAEDGLTSGWMVYTGDAATASFQNVTDPDRGGRVIELAGDGQNHGFALYSDNLVPWQHKGQWIVEWSMKYAEFFTVYIEVLTTDGRRYLQYTPVDYDNMGTGSLVHHGVGSDKADGIWRKFSRDLQQDLSDAQPGVTIEQVNGFLIRGSGRVDNIKLWRSSPDSDGDGLLDIEELNIYLTDPNDTDTDDDGLSDDEEILVYETSPNVPDTDGDLIPDGQEIDFWGSAWNGDADGDGLINLLDPDSDNDGVPDGQDTT